MNTTLMMHKCSSSITSLCIKEQPILTINQMTTVSFDNYDDMFDPSKYNITDVNLTSFRQVSCVWDHRSIEEIIWKSLIVLLIVIIGLLGNFIVIFLVIKRPKIRQQPVNIFIVNLAIADFLTTLFTPIVSLLTNIYQNYELGPIMCKLDIFIKMMCILASIFSVIAISFERFQNIAHLTSSASSRKIKWRIVVKLLLIWSLSIGLATPLAVWRTYQERKWSDYLEKWCTDNPSEYSKNYWIFLMSPLIYLPLIMLILIYGLMAIKIERFIQKMQREQQQQKQRKQQQQQKQAQQQQKQPKQSIYYTSNDSNSILNSIQIDSNSNQNNKQSSLIISAEVAARRYSTDSNSSSGNNSGSGNIQIKDFELFNSHLQKMNDAKINAKISANNHKRSIMITIIIYALITIIFWTPLQVLVYYRAFKSKRSLMPEWYEPVKFIAQLLCSINSAINPFITFRRTFAQIFRQFQDKRQKKAVLREFQIKNAVITAPNIAAQNCPNGNHLMNKKNDSIVSFRNRTNSIQIFCEDAIFHPEVITPISSTSGTPSRKAASLSKQVLMKYSPAYFEA